MKNNFGIIIAIAVIVGLIGFFGGMKYQENKLRNDRQFHGRVNSAGRQVVGEIIEKDDKSITVKMPDGSSKVVLFSTNMTINKSATASATDLKVGERVMTFGNANTDGSITAQSIQLNPQQRTGQQPNGTMKK